MAEESSWVPPETDVTKANIARVYDWWLGGSHNFPADQDLARAIIAVSPVTRAGIRDNRAFLGRAVRYLAAEAGIRQFLDIGSGIPTAQNVHQIAQRTAPGSRVVYVDNDDIAVAHSKLILDGDPDAVAVQADLRDPAAILAHPETRRLVDFTRPVAVLLVSVLHFVPDGDDPEGVLAALRDALAPGSYLVVTHACRDADPGLSATVENVYNSRVDGRTTTRTRDQIARFFGDFRLVEPGLTWLREWRPDPGQTRAPGPSAGNWALAGVARKPGR
ncbi:MAG: SAM-dependent methyltransferase [Nocardiopsaceae bacterium]|nr:SAM-dependent methyltransferase [Nocardiopsaceae bacterium]